MIVEVLGRGLEVVFSLLVQDELLCNRRAASTMQQVYVIIMHGERDSYKRTFLPMIGLLHFPYYNRGQNSAIFF